VPRRGEPVNLGHDNSSRPAIGDRVEEDAAWPSVVGLLVGVVVLRAGRRERMSPRRNPKTGTAAATTSRAAASAVAAGGIPHPAVALSPMRLSGASAGQRGPVWCSMPTKVKERRPADGR